jgi:hypothetical protein
MVSTTALTRDRSSFRGARLTVGTVLCCAACVAALSIAGCTGTGTGTGAPSSAATSTVGQNMAGPSVDVNVSRAIVDNVPKHWVLTSPETAVQSYLNWTSYAYRTAQSFVATKTMTPFEEVRVDSYIQFNIQKQRLLDQTLTGLKFGKDTVKDATATVSAVEIWSYRYLSIAVGNAVLSGPYTATYDTTYTVQKQPDGQWLVDSVEAKARGPVK